MLGTSAAIQQILKWGIENIAETLDHKANYILTALKDTSISAIDPSLRAPHYLGLRFPNGVPDGLSKSLAAQKIYVSVRGSSMRVTPHLYTSEADVDRLIEALRAH